MYIPVKDSLWTMDGGPWPILGRKHFDPKYDVPVEYRSQMRIFQQKYEHTDLEKYDEKAGFPRIPPRPRYHANKLILANDAGTCIR